MLIAEAQNWLDFPWHKMPWLFLAGLFAGFINSVAGGGGMITVPALLAFGLDIKTALGTNKLGATFGSCTATINYVAKKQVTIKQNLFGVLLTAIGAAAGVFFTSSVAESVLKLVVPLAMLGVLVYSILNRNLGMEESHQRVGKKVFYLMFGFALGFYDGFFGPGTGSFWILAFMYFLGYEMRKATAGMKLMNFTSNLVSLCVYAILGFVKLPYGISIGLGQMVGAKIGSNLAVSRGARFIRPVYLGMIAIAIVYMIYKYFLANLF